MKSEYYLIPEDRRIDTVIQPCYDAFLEDYGQNWNIKTKPYDGIPELLDTLSARRLKMAILSNKPHEYTRKCVTAFLPDWDFKAVLGQQDDIPGKPEPEGALMIAGQLNISPSDFLYIGDTETDLKTSIAAGMFPVGVLWGFRSANELLESGAKVLIRKPLEIMNLLD